MVVRIRVRMIMDMIIIFLKEDGEDIIKGFMEKI